MKRSYYALVVFVAMLSALGATLRAHHSFAAAYDLQKPVTVQGAIVQVRLTNPHSWFFLDVKEPDGKVTRWSFEAGTPSGMIRNGYKASEMTKGTIITIKGFHARDMTQNSGMVQQVILADGRTYGMFGPQEGGATR
jgi:Family of unknown function (DUF6152)